MGINLVNAGNPPISILGSTLFFLYMNDLPGDDVCNTAI